MLLLLLQRRSKSNACISSRTQNRKQQCTRKGARVLACVLSLLRTYSNYRLFVFLDFFFSVLPRPPLATLSNLFSISAAQERQRELAKKELSFPLPTLTQRMCSLPAHIAKCTFFSTTHLLFFASNSQQLLVSILLNFFKHLFFFNHVATRAVDAHWHRTTIGREKAYKLAFSIIGIG